MGLISLIGRVIRTVIHAVEIGILVLLRSARKLFDLTHLR